PPTATISHFASTYGDVPPEPVPSQAQSSRSALIGARPQAHLRRWSGMEGAAPLTARLPHIASTYGDVPPEPVPSQAQSSRSALIGARPQAHPLPWRCIAIAAPLTATISHFASTYGDVPPEPVPSQAQSSRSALIGARPQAHLRPWG